MDALGDIQILHSFIFSDGVYPTGSLVQGRDGIFYGTTLDGGAGSGTVFSMTENGVLTVLHAFVGTDGIGPAAGLIQGTDGLFYGTTAFGGNLRCAIPSVTDGTLGCGTIFKIDSSGNFQTLYAFLGQDGMLPISPLVQGANGTFYGATVGGLAATGALTFGTIFSMDSLGNLTPVHTFVGGSSDSGIGVLTAPPIQASDGNLYGTAAAPNGAVFKVDHSGNVTVLHLFANANTPSFMAGLFQAENGTFYGTIQGGGSLACSGPSGQGCGTIFGMDSSGNVNLINTFAGQPTDGSYPHAGLIQAANGALYGTAQYGGIANAGIIFQLSFTSQSPVITSLSPASVSAGGPSFLLTVNGSNFALDATILWNGTALATTFVNTSQLQALVASSLIGSQGSAAVTVSLNGSVSNPIAFAITATATPLLSISAVTNSASNAAGPMAAGSIATAKGTFLLGGSSTSSGPSWPSSLAGLSMSAGGLPTPLYFVSGNQINFQIPWELAGKSQASLSVNVGTQTSPIQTITIATYAPGIFSMNSQGNGQGAILDQSYQLVNGSNPATAGTTVIQIYCTGLGSVTNQPASGAPAPSNPLARTIATPTVTIGGITAPVLYSGLAPGAVGLYQIDAQVPFNASAGTAVPVAVSIGGVPSNTVTMAVQQAPTGTLQLQIGGLPSGVQGNVSVTSAAGFIMTVTDNQNLVVPVGTYTVSANLVPNGGVSFGAYPTQQSFTVGTGATVPVQVSYNVTVPQTTTMLDPSGIQGLSASPDGSTISLPAASQAAQSLAPGNVLAIGITPTTPNGLLRKVASVNQSGSQIIITTTQATLTDAFQQANFSFNAAITPQASGMQALRQGVTIGRASTTASSAHGAVARDQVQLTCLSDATLVEMEQVQIASDQYGSIQATGSIQMCPSLEFDWNIGGLPPTLNSLTATMTYGMQGHIAVSGRYDTSFDKQIPIATVTSEPIPVSVAGFPIVLTPTLTFYVGASGSLDAGFSVGGTETASVTGGVSYANGQLSPVFNKSTSFTLDPLSIDAQLTAKGYIGLTADLNVDGILSPEFSPDAYLQLNVDPTANPWWTLTGGVEGSASVKLGIFGVNFADFEYPNLFQYPVPIAQASGGFSTAAAAPTITSVTPNSAQAGSGSLTLTIGGTNFVPGAGVNFNGQTLATTYISANQLSAVVTASILAVPGTFTITVTNPDQSGATSSAVNFSVQGSVAALALQSIILNPPAVIGGNSVVGTVTLSNQAPTGGAQVSLSSNNPSVQVPATVTVPAGQTMGTFKITTSTVTSPQTATITAGLGASTMTTALAVSPPQGGAVFVTITEYPVATTADPGFLESISPGPDGALWFTDRNDNKIGRITTSGTITEYAIPTPDSQPDWITAGLDGALWFTEDVGKIGRITTGGTITEYKVASANSIPVGITSGPDGALWFTDQVGAIGRITTSGVITEYPVNTDFGELNYITAGPDGALWFADGVGKIGRITTSGVVVEYPVPSRGDPTGIAAGSDGALWFTENTGNNIGRITTDGMVSEYSLFTGNSVPFGITAGPDGALWFTEQLNGKIGRITTSGVITEYSVPTRFSSPWGITACPDGALWFTELDGNKIARATLTADVLQSLVLTSSSVVGGNSIGGTVALSAPAPTGGIQITLSSNNPNVQVPATVTVPAGQTMATFTVATSALTAAQSATISATLGSSSQTATISILPFTTTSGPPLIYSIMGKLTIAGMTVSMEIDVTAGFVILSDLNSAQSGLIIVVGMNTTSSVLGKTVTYTSTSIADSEYVNIPANVMSNISAATISATVPSFTNGATATGTVSLTVSGVNGPIKGTFTGTLSGVQ